MLIFSCICVINAGIKIVNMFLMLRKVPLGRWEGGSLPVTVLRLSSYGSPVGEAYCNPEEQMAL